MALRQKFFAHREKDTSMDQSTLQTFENRCTADSLPACQAACPLHLDARGFIGHIQGGKWDKARAILEKKLPFPPLMSLLCDHPCEAVCRRAEKGDALAIKALELTCLNTTPPGKTQKRLPSKKQGVAVFGCGLSGLTAAWDLALKGYDVTLYHQTKHPQEFLRETAHHYLPSFATNENFEAALANAFSLLESYDVKFQETSAPKGLEAFQEKFDAIFVDVEDYTIFTPSEPVNKLAGTVGDNFNVVFGSQSPSSAMKAYEGRRGATTIIRVLGKSSPLAMREKEGPYQTDLFVDISAISTMPRVKGSPNGQADISTDTPKYADCPLLTAEQASQEAARCLQCACLHCVKSCTYLTRYSDIPKHSARKMFVNLGIFTGYRRANQQINSCALCGQCETLCPNDFAMGELCLLMRKDMVKQGKMPPSAHDFALRELEWSTAPSATLFWGKSETEPCSHVFFPGCQLSAARPNQVRFIFRHLRQSFTKGTLADPKNSSPNMGIWLRCCGIPAHFAGRDDLTQEQVDALQSQWQTLGKPKVIAACASCLRFFQDYLPHIPIVSLWEILDKEAPLPVLANPQALPHHPIGTMHDPCSARHNSGWQKAVRNLFTKHGVAFEEPYHTAETTACCGYGGLVWNANPTLAEQMVKDRAEALPSIPLTSCIMCRDRLVETGKDSLHLFDILLPSEKLLEKWLANPPRTTPVTDLFHHNGHTPQSDTPLQELQATSSTAGPGFSLRRVTRITLKEAFMTKEYELSHSAVDSQGTSASPNRVGSPNNQGKVEKVWKVGTSGNSGNFDTLGNPYTADPLANSGVAGEPTLPTLSIKLVIAPDVLLKAEKQHILVQDMQETILQSEKEGTLFISNEGLHRAHNRQGSITFWVEYRKEDHSRVILDAYYHRMTISKA